jgi:hypothetical protein
LGIDALLAVLKFVGAATAGVLGVTGLIFDFKNSAGRLNRTGYYVLAGIIVAAFVGMGSSVLEAYKAESEAKQQRARTEQLLREIDRAVQPITMLKTTYWLEIVPKDEVVTSYIDQIRRTIENKIDDLRKRSSTQDGVYASATDIDGDPLSITIDQKSALWPHDDASYIGDAAREFAFGIFMMREPVRPPISIVVGAADSADFSASPFPFDPPKRLIPLCPGAQNVVAGRAGSL